MSPEQAVSVAARQDPEATRERATTSAVGEALAAAENALRDLIETVLGGTPDWLKTSGLSPERMAAMEGRQRDEASSRGGGVANVEARTLYYAELFDLQTILDKHWSKFAPCLGDRKTFMAMFERMEDFRNPDAHGRELLPFARHLALGITGEIRNRVAIFRSGSGPTKQYFPHIESIRDHFGHVVSGHSQGSALTSTGITLHSGDEVVFELRAWDPEGAALRWEFTITGREGVWEVAPEDGLFTWHVREVDIGETVTAFFNIVSSRPYHRDATNDDYAMFSYRVLPK
ncbi:MAG: hypothetical protein ACLQBX_15245 [Candidatus Limnocylindrales bacterium]